MKNKPINKVFKQVLKSFMKEEMNSCSSLIIEIEKCKTYGDLKKCLEDNVNTVAEHLGYECEECEDKDYDIKKMTRENLELDDRLYESFTPVTLWDEQKLKVFKEKKDNFTPEEFESLLD